jgi:hypothetical protein
MCGSFVTKVYLCHFLILVRSKREISGYYLLSLCFLCFLCVKAIIFGRDEGNYKINEKCPSIYH